MSITVLLLLALTVPQPLHLAEGPPHSDEMSAQSLIILQRLSDRISTESATRVAQLQALHEEKFRAMEAAMLAAEKHHTDMNTLQSLAIAKTESTMLDQLKGLNTAIQEVERTLNDRGQTLKERLDRIEGQATGVSTSWGVIVALIGIGVGVIGFVRSLRIQRPS